MLHNRTECREASRMLESYTRERRPRSFYREIHQLLENKQLDPNQIPLFELFGAFVPDGYELRETFRPGYSHEPWNLVETAGGSVDTGAFSNIIGQITYSTVLSALESPEFIAQDLCGAPTPATTQQEEILPGIGMIGDKAEEVGEDEDYPRVGVNEEYITIPRKPKDGFIVPVTEEAIWEDKTGGLLMQRVNAAAESMGITMEKEGLDVVMGTTTSYSRNGGDAQATYGNTHTEGTFDNLTTNALVDYTDVEIALLLFDAITDPNTGEPVLLNGQMMLVVPTDLEMTARRILNATEVRQGAVSATVPLSLSANPLVGYRRQFQLMSNQYVKARNGGSATGWVLGDTRNAFEYREVWPLRVQRMSRNSEAGFSRDVVTQVKVKRKGVYYIKEPRKVVKSTGAA